MTIFEGYMPMHDVGWAGKKRARPSQATRTPRTRRFDADADSLAGICLQKPRRNRSQLFHAQRAHEKGHAAGNLSDDLFHGPKGSAHVRSPWATRACGKGCNGRRARWERDRPWPQSGVGEGSRALNGPGEICLLASDQFGESGSDVPVGVESNLSRRGDGRAERVQDVATPRGRMRRWR